MNVTLPKATGINYATQLLQTRLYSFLKGRWGVSDNTYNAFGMTERVNVENGYIPLFYDAAKQAYVDGSDNSSAGGMFYEESLAAVSFFGLVNVKKTAGRYEQAKTELLFFVSLDKIKPGGMTTVTLAGQRADEVAINDVKNFVQNNGCGFVVMETVKDVDKVLERYSGAAKRRALMDNMNNKLCFKLTMEVVYNPQLHIS